MESRKLPFTVTHSGQFAHWAGIVFTVAVFICLLPCHSSAQNPAGPPVTPPAVAPQPGANPAPSITPLDPKTAQIMQAAATKGFPLPAQTVAQNVSIEAVLLPYEICRKVFGKEIALNYAAIELTISNRSADQSLIVHSIFIDYSDWALSGHLYTKASSNAPESDAYGGKPEPWQASTRPNQVSSVEYRVARGELLDASTWTSRNWAIRALKAAGSIASAYAFSINEKGIVRGIAAFSGQVVPAAETFWPDGTVGQMNRISDLGFQVNKVIPKSSSDIVVAFFPIDRFLTPGLKKLFLKSPALFFAPYALIFDSSAKQDLKPFFKDMFGGDDKKAEEFLQKLPKVYMNDYLARLDKPDCAKLEDEKHHLDCANPKDLSVKNRCDEIAKTTEALKCSELSASQEQIDGIPVDQIMRFLAHASLNTVHVIVGADMTVNVDTVPATIQAIEMEGGNNSQQVWTTTGEHKGTIQGSFLAGGTPAILEATTLGISDIATDAKNSTDKQLVFTMKLSKTISSGEKLTFKVIKKDKQNNSVESTPFVFPVQYSSASLSKALLNGSTLGITGQDLTDTTASPLKVLLFSAPAKDTADITLDNKSFTLKSPSELTIDFSRLKDVTLTPACWTVKAQIGGTPVANDATFAKVPSPKITSAQIQGENIVVQGADFIDLKDCGHPLGFVIIDAAGARHPVANPKPESSQKISFPTVPNAKQVVVQVDGKDVDTAKNIG